MNPHQCLVVWNMKFYDFPYIGNFIIPGPTDELIFFRGVGLNHQADFHLLNTQLSAGAKPLGWRLRTRHRGSEGHLSPATGRRAGVRLVWFLIQGSHE